MKRMPTTVLLALLLVRTIVIAVSVITSEAIAVQVDFDAVELLNRVLVDIVDTVSYSHLALARSAS